MQVKNNSFIKSLAQGSLNYFIVAMKPERIYQDLKELAEKLGVTVSEQNLRKTGIKVKSGLCKVKGKKLFIMDKHISFHEKNEILSSCLSKFHYEDIFMVPALRKYLDKHTKLRDKVEPVGQCTS